MSSGRKIQEAVHGLQTGGELVLGDSVVRHGNDLAPQFNFSGQLRGNKILEGPVDISEVVKKLRKA